LIAISYKDFVDLFPDICEMIASGR
jgi:hypothetical protein